MNETPAPSGRQHLVMLVDDEQSILNALQRLLRREGYRIVTATTGSEALDLLDHLARDDSMASVVVSDFRMPGMNGVEFLTRVRERYPNTVRMVLSGFADADSIESAINKGEVFKFLSKPWDDDNLKAVVRASITRHEAIEQTRAALGRMTALEQEAQRVGIALYPEGADDPAGEPAEPDIISCPTEGFESAMFAFWQQVIDHLPAALVGVDRDGLVVVANPQVELLLGIDRLATVGNVARDVLPAQLADLVHAVLDTGERCAVRIAINGRQARIQCLPLRGKGRREVRGALLFAFDLEDTN